MAEAARPPDEPGDRAVVRGDGGFASLIIAHHLARDGYGAMIAGKH
jgi:hypothetical protein